MSSHNIKARKNGKLLCGHQFLDCLKLLYSEALRLELHLLTDVLESTFEKSTVALEKEGVPIRDNHRSIVEFHFLKEFRSLDKEQQRLLIESIQRSDTDEIKH
jgi:hypothetical protein